MGHSGIKNALKVAELVSIPTKLYYTPTFRVLDPYAVRLAEARLCYVNIRFRPTQPRVGRDCDFGYLAFDFSGLIKSKPESKPCPQEERERQRQNPKPGCLAVGHADTGN